MDIAAWIGVLVSAVIPLYALVVITKRTDDRDHERDQAERIRDLSRALEDCQQERRRLERREIDLMQRILEANPTEGEKP